MTKRRGVRRGFIALCAIVTLTLAGCGGDDGKPGAPGQPGDPGISSGTLQGTVTNKLSGAGVGGVAVALDPAVAGTSIVTAADGSYSAELPIGVYAIAVKATNYQPAAATASVIAGGTATRDIALEPVAPVIVTTRVDGEPVPGNALTASATVTVMDGSTLTGVTWTQSSGVALELTPGANNSVDFTLPNVTTFKDRLFEIVADERHALLDRNMVMGIAPLDLEETVAIALTVRVDTSAGTYSRAVEVDVELPFAWQGGVRRVALGVPLLLHGKPKADGEPYQWSIAAPSGSQVVALEDGTTQNPYFAPDAAGKYVVTEPDIGANIEIFAGSWVGAIGEDGGPSAVCITCHNGSVAPDKFTPWSHSGHAEIFTQNLNAGGHYSSSCFPCHTVGYNLAAENNGVDDQAGYPPFLDTFFPGGHSPPMNPDNWNTVLATYPDVARLANVQCENCHGPIDNASHRQLTSAQAGLSIASDVCGVCHGEPARHGRFQQWQTSQHANYALAMQEATVEGRGATAGHCGRCHSGQGFLAWIQQDDLTLRIQGANGNATVEELTALGLTRDAVHPQTCTVCHDPHAQGTTSGEPNTATVRVSGSTSLLPAGFAAAGVGRGAICITCHNTRNGAHNDDVGTPSNYSAPHVAAQGDVLMGQNAYFVNVGARSPHSFIDDTCATCHMELTPPPPEFSFSGAGTNHSFTASLSICGQCHGVFDGGTLQATIEHEIEELAETMSAYLLARIDAGESVVLSDYTPHEFGGKAYDVKSAPMTVASSNITSLAPTEPHGQQGYIVNFATPVEFTYAPAGESPHTVALTQAEVQLGDIVGSDTGKSIVGASDPLVRAGWNYFLVHGDGSKGVHNPDFTEAVLAGATAALREAMP